MRLAGNTGARDQSLSRRRYGLPCSTRVCLRNLYEQRLRLWEEVPSELAYTYMLTPELQHMDAKVPDLHVARCTLLRHIQEPTIMAIICDRRTDSSRIVEVAIDTGHCPSSRESGSAQSVAGEPAGQPI